MKEIASGGGVPLERVVRYAVQIADAAAHAHDHGIVHRDLKGLNVIITAGRRVKILDFGLATHTWSEGAEYAATIHLTHRDVIAGTIAYMAPEVLPDVGDVGSRGAWSMHAEGGGSRATGLTARRCLGRDTRVAGRCA